MQVDREREKWFWRAQGLSLARVALVFGFVVTSPFQGLWRLTAGMYLCAGLTDFFDGRLARAKKVTTQLGSALDIFGDRYFSIISCLYVGIRGVWMVPLAVIILRELYSVAMRMVQVHGEGVMMQSRWVGGAFHVTVAIGTLGFITSPYHYPSVWCELPFYTAALFYLGYLPYSIVYSRRRIRAAIREGLNAASDRPS